jgi:hypothetical protein
MTWAEPKTRYGWRSIPPTTRPPIRPTGPSRRPPKPQVVDDHLFVNPLLGYVNPADNKCGTGSLNIGSGPTTDAFDPKSVFGHMHPGPAEWWIVQVGKIRGRFENAGEFHADEGDVLYAAPMSWHEMAAEASSGPSVRLAMGGYT